MNKKLIIPIVVSIATIGVVVGVTYAFFSANVVENNKTETVIKTNELNITYTGGTEITASNMIPGNSTHYSNLSFYNTLMIDGKGCKWTDVLTTECNGMPSFDGNSTIKGNSGNGYAKITYLGE